jgi:hypothetical protein
MESAIDVGMVQPTTGPTTRSAQVMGASGFMTRLPTFPDATVDEVIDIRAELASSLVRFRGAMVSTSRAFSSAPWGADFQDELHDLWIETVRPAVAEIEAAVQDNHSMLRMAAGVAGAVKEALPGLAILGAGMAGHSSTVSEIGGAVTAVSPVLSAAWHRHVDERQIQTRPFYFLYQLGESL